MVHPYIRRRRGPRGGDAIAHPSLEPILARTLGVPLFQEQLLRMAMVAAGFSGSEAEELRRAFGFKRSERRMGRSRPSCARAWRGRGSRARAADEIVHAITAFALYGFPESHASSFALLAYASAWLKVRQPAAFYAALLNNQPMGFYHPATIVKDAQRHGLAILPIDVTRSSVGRARSRRCARAVRLGPALRHGAARDGGPGARGGAAARPFDLGGRPRGAPGRAGRATRRRRWPPIGALRRARRHAPRRPVGGGGAVAGAAVRRRRGASVRRHAGRPVARR